MMECPYRNDALRERFRALMVEDGTITPEEGRLLKLLDGGERRG